MSDHRDTIARIEKLARQLGEALRQTTARDKRNAVKQGRKLLVECFTILEEARALDDENLKQAQQDPDGIEEPEEKEEPEGEEPEGEEPEGEEPEGEEPEGIADSTARALYSIERKLRKAASAIDLDELAGPSLRGYFDVVSLTFWDPIYLKATRPRRDIGEQAVEAQSFAESRDRRIEAFLDVLGFEAPDDEDGPGAYQRSLLDGSTDPILIKRKKPKKS